MSSQLTVAMARLSGLDLAQAEAVQDLDFSRATDSAARS
jgi:hypothetical protein